MVRFLKQIRAYKFSQMRLSSNKPLEHLDLSQQHLEIHQQEDEKSDIPAIRYNVCRDRSGSNTQKYNFPKSPSSNEQSAKLDNMEHFIENRDLSDRNNDSSYTMPPSAGYRQFEASSTYKNLVLPLKVSKLSDPFPSPVKMMRSHTVSDQEKADQMMSERRIPRSIAKKKT